MHDEEAIVRRWFEEGINRGDLSALDEIFDPEVVAHEPAGDVAGIDDGPRRAVQTLRAGLPNLRIEINDLLVDSDRVAVRWTATGSHEGELLGFAPTGNTVSFNAIYIYRISGGRIAEVWASPDAMGLIRQLGG